VENVSFRKSVTRSVLAKQGHRSDQGKAWEEVERQQSALGASLRGSHPGFKQAGPRVTPRQPTTGGMGMAGYRALQARLTNWLGTIGDFSKGEAILAKADIDFLWIKPDK